MDQQQESAIAIAVLDDDTDFLAYVEDFLNDEGGYAVRTCTDPGALLASDDRRPDIVLLDMKMGEHRGDRILEQILAKWPGVCVVIVTGYPSLEDMRATFKLKVFDYLAKPFSLAQLRQVISNAIEAFGLGRVLQDKLRDKLGHRIRLLRADRDWSLKDLAERSRLSVSQISSIERGANLPSMESLLALSRAFELKPSDILSAIDF